MSPETKAILDRMKPARTVWCQHGQLPGSPIDEHQTCLDMEAYHRSKGGAEWSCTCRCHR